MLRAMRACLYVRQALIEKNRVWFCLVLIKYIRGDRIMAEKSINPLKLPSEIKACANWGTEQAVYEIITAHEVMK